MDISHILRLARLELGKKEKIKIEREFSNILNFVKKLQELNFKEKEVYGDVKKINIFREDEVVELNQEEKKLLENCIPESKDGYLKIKKIL